MVKAITESILVDTDILIDVGRKDRYATDFVRQRTKEGRVYISSVTRMELLIGCRNKAEQKSLEIFLERFVMIHITEKISETALALMNRFRLSHGLLIPDAIIAATAIVFEIPFFSQNRKDYAFISDLKLERYQ